MEVNYSKDSEYHTQLNNKKIPHASCNTTSLIMALKQAGYTLKNFPQDQQPEDYLTDFMQGNEAYKKMETLTPWVYSETKPLYPPNEVHRMLQWGINTLIGDKTDRFSTRCMISTLIDHLDEGGGAALSGEFPYQGRYINHMVSLAGYITDYTKEKSLEHITHFIIDDPYGDYHTGYDNHKGNNVVMRKTEFLLYLNPGGNHAMKWAHLIGKAD